MIGDFWWLLAVACAISANIVVHVFLSRSYPAGGMYRALLAGFLSGCAALAVTAGIFAARPVWSHLTNLAIYLSFSYVYFHWNNLGETGRRIRLIIELRSAKEGLTRADILARYGHCEIVDRRLDRLLGSRQIRIVGSSYHLDNPSVFMMARLIALMKRILALT